MQVSQQHRFCLGVLVLSLGVLAQESEAFAAEVTEIIGVVRLGVSVVEYMYKVFAQIAQDPAVQDLDVLGKGNSDTDKELLDQYYLISIALEQLAQSNIGVETTIRQLQQNLPQIIRRELKLDRVDSIVRAIASNYKTFEFYQELADQIDRHTLQDFATSVTSHGFGSIRFNLNELHSLVAPKDGILGNVGIFELLSNGVEGDQYICSMDQSPHQLLYNLYNVIALSEIKGYAMIQFSYMILELDSERNYTVESDRAKSAFEKQAKEKLQIVTGILKSISTNFWKCDPLNHKETQTYIRMTQLLQGIIENEADIHPDGSCKNECSDFTTGFEVLRCTKDRVCSHQNRCEGGRVYDCQFHDRDADVCFSSDPTRRYDYVKYEDGTVLGKYDRCMNGKKHKVDSWWRFPYHCSMCVCKCDAEGPESDRYWSLKPLTADLDQGKVVIGVRFVKRNRVIQMDIMQAQALPEGSVNETTKAWKLAPPVDIQKASPKELFTMNYKVRDLDLDVLEVPTGSVVTGIRFRDLGGHVNLEIQATPIQFANGSLKTDQSVWIGNDNTPASTTPRRYLHIIQPDVPIRNRLSTIVSENNQFIRFDTSDVHKDAMQSTIPYIDAQPVTTYPGTWLSGLGLYYKGRNGYGGFVGPMIQTFNFSEHLLPKEDKPETFDMEAMKSERHVRVLSRQRLHA